MKWLELLNMEYGECVVLGGGDRSLLMVDCGSVSQKLREGDVPLDAWLETIAARYEPAMERWFLLTHFHRDHLSGFQKLLESREGYFSRVFLPRAPVDSHGVPLLLEYALFAYLFAQPQSDAFQVNTWCVKAFRTLEQRLFSPWAPGTASALTGWSTRCCGPGWRATPSSRSWPRRWRRSTCCSRPPSSRGASSGS